MSNIFSKIKEEITNSNDVVFVSVYGKTGSAPRGVGAKMLVNQDGRVYGTVGGGSVENEAIAHAISLINAKKSDMCSFKLHPNQVKDLGMVCGGEVSLFFQYIDKASEEIVALCDKAIDNLENAVVSWIVTDISDKNDSGEMFIIDKTEVAKYEAINLTDSAKTEQLGDKTFLVEPLVPSACVYVFGGGHVAQAFVPIASNVGFRCVVLDDREEFLKPELFPTAHDIINVDFSDIQKSVSLTNSDYLVIMTRGHAYDEEIQSQALLYPSKYIGVMGSKSKILHVNENLRAMGFNDQDIARIHTPIGLEIGAETPEEIAVSIVAELIQVRSGKI